MPTAPKIVCPRCGTTEDLGPPRRKTCFLCGGRGGSAIDPALLVDYLFHTQGGEALDVDLLMSLRRRHGLPADPFWEAPK